MSIWQIIARRAATVVRTGGGGQLLRALGFEDSAAGKPTLGVAFTIAIVALSAKMAKSDGQVTADEIEAFRRVCVFPPSEEANVRRVFDVAKQDVAGFESYARQVGRMLEGEPTLRRDVLEALFAIAAADGILHEAEERYLKEVADSLGVTSGEYGWVRSLFVTEGSSPYGVLGLTPAATDAEIKARYRALVLEHHPDRLMGRGVPEEFLLLAERTLAGINAAYDAVAQERGF